MKGPVKEIFVRSLVLFDMFFTEFGVKAEEFQAVIIEDRLVACDRLAREVITKILILIKTLDSIKDKEEVNFWKIQAKSVEYFMDIHSKAATLKQSLLRNPNHPSQGSEEVERFLSNASAIVKGARLDLNGFERINGIVHETKVSEAECIDENFDKVEETKETIVIVEDQNKLDRKVDNNPQVVENVTENPKVFKKQNDDDQEERVGLDDIHDHEANGNFKNELLEENYMECFV